MAASVLEQCITNDEVVEAEEIYKPPIITVRIKELFGSLMH